MKTSQKIKGILAACTAGVLGLGAFADVGNVAYAKLDGEGYKFYDTTGQEVAAPEGGLTLQIPLAFADDAEYQELVAAPERVALSKGAVLETDVVLTADADWTAQDFDLNGHVITLAGSHLKMGRLSGTGAVTSSGEYIANGGFDTDVIDSGAAVSLAPKGWVVSGGCLLLKNNVDYAYDDRNNSNRLYFGSKQSASQTFTIVQEGDFKITFGVSSKSWASSWMRSVAFASLAGQDLYRAEPSYKNQTQTFTKHLNPGTYTLTIGHGENYNNTGNSFENVSVQPVANFVNRTSILEIVVPEGEVVENTGVLLGGGASLQVWKSGKGKLVMSKLNNGFGAANAIAGWESIVVKEGILTKATTSATCGVQYSRIGVEDGARYEVTGREYWDYDYAIAGAGPDGAGALYHAANGVTDPWRQSTDGFLRNIELTADATIGGSQSWGTIFYNYGANTMTLNGHTLTYSGALLYGGNMSYSGEGTVVITNNCTVEYYNATPSARDVTLEVRGTLQQHGNALTPVKSLIFTETGSFNNPWDTRPQFVVRNTYAPNVNTAASSLAMQPTVTLGTATDLNTTLDLSLHAGVYDCSTLTFQPGSIVTVNLGSRTFNDGEKVVAWAQKPAVEDFHIAGVAAEDFSLKAKDDGLYIAAIPAYAKITPSTGEWSFFSMSGKPVTTWEEGVTGDVEVRFSTDAEYQALGQVTSLLAQAKRVALETNSVLTADADWTAFDFNMDGHVITLAGSHLKLGKFLGTGAVTSSGDFIANGGFDTDVIASGSAVSLAPKGWVVSGGCLLLNNSVDYAYDDRNNSNRLYFGSRQSASQTFTIVQEGDYKVSFGVSSKSWSSAWMRSVGFASLAGQDLYRAEASWHNQTQTYTKHLNPGTYTLTIGHGENYNNTGNSFENVSVVPVANYVNRKSILELVVPEGEEMTTAGLLLGGGASLQVWKSGKGRLVMSKVNNGFGAANAIAGWESLIVKEGVVVKSANANDATCGTQYARIAVEDGGQFDVNGRSYSYYDYEIAGTGPDGSGALVNSASVSSPWTASNAGYVRNLSLGADAVIGGTQTWGVMAYNNAANTMTLNGHTLTFAGPSLYTVNTAYAGEGMVVITNNCTVEFYTSSSAASDATVEVRGTLQQHDGALSTVKSLIFTETGSFNNPWDTRPQFVVRNTYAPNLNTTSGSKAVHPIVTLGTATDLETALDLALFTGAFDSTDLTFQTGSTVTVNLGSRRPRNGDQLIAWSAIPEGVEFALTGDDAKYCLIKLEDQGLFLNVVRGTKIILR